MSDGDSSNPVTTTQIMGILAATLALFFMVAFATKAIDAYRLKNWRDRLLGEISEMRRDHAELEEELRLRQSPEWAEEVLRDAGLVTEGMVRVVPVTSTPLPAEVLQEGQAVATPEADIEPETLEETSNWKAWQRLILGFDES